MKTEQECGYSDQRDARYSDEVWRRRRAESLMEEYVSMAEREKKERHDAEFMPLWMLLLQSKVSFFPWLKLLWSKRADLFATYPGFFYLCIAVFQIMLIPILLCTHALLDPGFDKAPFVSNLVSVLMWVTLTLDIVSHVLVLYVFVNLDVFDS